MPVPFKKPCERGSFRKTRALPSPPPATVPCKEEPTSPGNDGSSERESKGSSFPLFTGRERLWSRDREREGERGKSLLSPVGSASRTTTAAASPKGRRSLLSGAFLAAPLLGLAPSRVCVCGPYIQPSSPLSAEAFSPHRRLRWWTVKGGK